MKKSLCIVLAATLLLAASAFAQIQPPPPQQGSNLYTQTFPAVKYLWQGVIVNGNSATGSQTVLLYTSGAFPDNRNGGTNPLSSTLLPPVQFNGETLTPSAITCGQARPQGSTLPAGGYLCNFTATFGAIHGANEPIRSGDGGILEAAADALSYGGGEVTFDRSIASGNSIYTTLTATVPYPSIYFKDSSNYAPQYWTVNPAATALLAAPTTLTAQAACDATHTFCSDATVAGSASWGGTVHCGITLVDILGNESPSSADASFTSVASKAIDIGAPAAVTSNVVGWKPYCSVSGGSYALMYAIPLLTQPTVLGAAPVSTGVCTLTTIETTTPACAIANSTYGQAASTTGAGGLFTAGGAQITGYPVVTSTLAPEIGSASALQHNPNEEAHATYKYVPSSHVGTPGVQTAHLVFPITAAAQTTIGEVMGSIPLPANFMNYVGRTIEVCGLIAKTSTVADTVDEVQLWWDAEGSNVTAGTPVQLTAIRATEAVALAAAANFQFCQQIQTTVAATTATGGTIAPGQGWMTVAQTAAGANPSTGTSALTAAVGSLNLALPAHLTIELKHTTGTDGAGATLIGASVRVVN